MSLVVLATPKQKRVRMCDTRSWTSGLVRAALSRARWVWRQHSTRLKEDRVKTPALGVAVVQAILVLCVEFLEAVEDDEAEQGVDLVRLELELLLVVGLQHFPGLLAEEGVLDAHPVALLVAGQCLEVRVHLRGGVVLVEGHLAERPAEGVPQDALPHHRLHLLLRDLLAQLAHVLPDHLADLRHVHLVPMHLQELPLLWVLVVVQPQPEHPRVAQVRLAPPQAEYAAHVLLLVQDHHLAQPPVRQDHPRFSCFSCFPFAVLAVPVLVEPVPDQGEEPQHCLLPQLQLQIYQSHQRLQGHQHKQAQQGINQHQQMKFNFRTIHLLANSISSPFARRLFLIPPMLLYGYYSQDTLRCYLDLHKNQIDNRYATFQYPANDTIEDRYQTTQLNSIGGYVVSVFDGHGGWQLAEYASKRLHSLIDQALRDNHSKLSGDDLVLKSVEQAYDQIEKEFYQIALVAYNFGLPSVARIGACALTAVVANDKVYTSNLGDCKGILVNPDHGFKKLNRMLNANSKKEQARLKKEYPKDEDIVVCKKSGACYVKKRLQPTRTIGDFRLKYKEFNNPNKELEEKGYSRKIKHFHGPYINAVPEHRVIPLDQGDRYLVMGSDGLWDQLTKQEVTEVVKANRESKDKILQALFDEALKKAAKSANMTVEAIKAVKQGKKTRRQLHDDMTILVVDLKNQIN